MALTFSTSWLMSRSFRSCDCHFICFSPLRKWYFLYCNALQLFQRYNKGTRNNRGLYYGIKSLDGSILGTILEKRFSFWKEDEKNKHSSHYNILCLEKTLYYLVRQVVFFFFLMFGSFYSIAIPIFKNSEHYYILVFLLWFFLLLLGLLQKKKNQTLKFDHSLYEYKGNTGICISVLEIILMTIAVNCCHVPCILLSSFAHHSNFMRLALLLPLFYWGDKIILIILILLIVNTQ